MFFTNSYIPKVTVDSMLSFNPHTFACIWSSRLFKFFGRPALWSPQKVYGPPTMVATVDNSKDQVMSFHVLNSLNLFLLMCLIE